MKRVPVLCLVIPVLLCGTVSAVDPDGDVNVDGEVDVVDVLWGYQVLMDARVLGTEQEMHGDVAPLVSGVPAPDGIFDLGDVLVILRLATGDLALEYCGDGLIQYMEQCDDGNHIAGDGCDVTCMLEPTNQFNIGDSIGEGEAADGTIGEAHHETVWSTGYAGGDSVNAFNERFESVDSAGYYENNAGRDPVFNHAVSGAVMGDFAGQAQSVVASTSQTPSGGAGQVTVFLGSNDVCADSNADMTDPVLFEAQYRAGLDVLASDASTQYAQIHVSGIPAIYWLWNAERNNLLCRWLIWPQVPCQNLLANAGTNDCASSASLEDPDNVYPGDGTVCQRRKEFHRLIRETYNPILREVLEEYRAAGDLPNASYIDIFDIRFDSAHVNNGDCFHPSEAGHALIADRQWCRSQWGTDDPQCTN
jgi:cysteine-rich repeat protein